MWSIIMTFKANCQLKWLIEHIPTLLAHNKHVDIK